MPAGGADAFIEEVVALLRFVLHASVLAQMAPFPAKRCLVGYVIDLARHALLYPSRGFARSRRTAPLVVAEIVTSPAADVVPAGNDARLMNGELRLPDEDCFPAHAHHGAVLASAFGPFRFVVVGDLRRHLPPRPARERPRYPALAPGILELVSIDHHQKIDIRAMRVRAFAQPCSVGRSANTSSSQRPGSGVVGGLTIPRVSLGACKRVRD